MDVYKNQNNSKPVKESFKINYYKLNDYANQSIKVKIFKILK